MHKANKDIFLLNGSNIQKMVSISKIIINESRKLANKVSKFLSRLFTSFEHFNERHLNECKPRLMYFTKSQRGF